MPHSRRRPIFVGHRNLPRALAAHGPYYLEAFRRSMGTLLDDVRIVAPTLTVDGEIKLDLGNRSLALKAWRAAHSDNDLTVLDEATRHAVRGRSCCSCSMCPVLDGSIRGWLAAIDELARIPAKQVIPGHGPVSAWPGALAAERAYLERLAADCRDLIKRGVPLAEAARVAGAAEKPHWRAFRRV